MRRLGGMLVLDLLPKAVQRIDLAVDRHLEFRRVPISAILEISFDQEVVFHRFHDFGKPPGTEGKLGQRVVQCIAGCYNIVGSFLCVIINIILRQEFSEPNLLLD